MRRHNFRRHCAVPNHSAGIRWQRLFRASRIDISDLIHALQRRQGNLDAGMEPVNAQFPFLGQQSPVQNAVGTVQIFNRRAMECRNIIGVVGRKRVVYQVHAQMRVEINRSDDITRRRFCPDKSHY